VSIIAAAGIGLRLLIAGVFGAAGLGKLLSPRATRTALKSFSVPASLVVPVSAALPALELSICVLLLSAQFSVVGAGLAVATLTVFTAAVAYNLSAGRAPDCNCFGKLGSGPVGWRTVVRNVLLIVLAAAIPFLPAPGGEGNAVLAVLDAAGLREISRGIQWLLAALVVQMWIISNLIVQNGRILLRLDRLESGTYSPAQASGERGLPPGSPAPRFAVTSLSGRVVDFPHSSGSRALLAFVDTACSPCAIFLAGLSEMNLDHPENIPVIVIANGESSHVRGSFPQANPDHVFPDPTGRIAKSYHAFFAAPLGVMVDAEGRIESPVIAGPSAILETIRLHSPRPLNVRGVQ
jgi:hypothetical protein